MAIKAIVDKFKSIIYSNSYGTFITKDTFLDQTRIDVEFYIEQGLYKDLCTHLITDTNLVGNKVLLKYCKNIPQSKLKEHNITRAIKPGKNVSTIFGSYWEELSKAELLNCPIKGFDEKDRAVLVRARMNREQASEFIDWIINPTDVIIESTLINKINSLEPEIDAGYVELVKQYLESQDNATKRVGFELLAKLDYNKYQNLLKCFFRFFDPKKFAKSKEIQVLVKNVDRSTKYRYADLREAVAKFNEAEQNCGMPIVKDALKRCVNSDEYLSFVTTIFDVKIKHGDDSFSL